MANSGSTNVVQHPLQATASAIGGSGGDPRTNRMSLLNGANDSAADTAAKITGVSQGGKREDDAQYFTDNEGHPWPDP